MSINAVNRSAVSSNGTGKRKRSVDSPLFGRFLIISLVIQYFWFIFGQIILYPRDLLRTLDAFLLFTAMYAVHFVLHCYARRILQRPCLTIGYIVIQSCLIFALSMVGEFGEMREWLFLPLLGELVLYTGTLWYAIFTASVMFGFSIVQGYIQFAQVYWDRMLVNVLWWTVWWTIGQSPYVSTLLLQVWGRRQAVGLLNELDAAHRQLAEYALQVEKLTLTAERSRMARELHDTLAQGLTGTVLQLEALEAYLEIGDTSKAVNIATQAKKRARTALVDSRRAIDDLRLQPEEQMPLAELIRHEVERFSEATGISYTLDVLPELWLPQPADEHLLRSISEGLANIARHAKATHVILLIAQKGNKFHIQLKDNGVGFDTASKDGISGHYGLLGMRERMRLIGGTFEVQSKIGAGTTIDIHIQAVEEA